MATAQYVAALLRGTDLHLVLVPAASWRRPVKPMGAVNFVNFTLSRRERAEPMAAVHFVHFTASGGKERS